MQLSVGLIEGREKLTVDLVGKFANGTGQVWNPGRYSLTEPVTLKPTDSSTCVFTLHDVTIGIGFHWERREQHSFRGELRVIRVNGGLTAVNRVDLEEYVTSVISSEMSASCPMELLKAHAVIARSWLLSPSGKGTGTAEIRQPGEITRWYGREAHTDFDVCADDHCQRYQGITRLFSSAAVHAVRLTAGEVLRYEGVICDARFSKCCGGISEEYRSAWDDREIPYLRSVYDGDGDAKKISPEDWITSRPPAFCDTQDPALLATILPNFDQETRDFYRWRVALTSEELRSLIRSKLDVDLGRILNLQPLERGPSGRIVRLKLIGEGDTLVIGKELEIRRALSPTHLYSSAFVVRNDDSHFILDGAGWGHGVGLCQIGAAMMASRGRDYREILTHYYRQTDVGVL